MHRPTLRLAFTLTTFKKWHEAIHVARSASHLFVFSQEVPDAMRQGEGGVQLLLVDNVAAFYWLDRATPPLPACTMDPSKDAHLGLQQAHACIAAELQALMREHRLAIIATKQAVLSASSSTFERWRFL